jgi:hypothetical protein
MIERLVSLEHIGMLSIRLNTQNFRIIGDSRIQIPNSYHNMINAFKRHDLSPLSL